MDYDHIYSHSSHFHPYPFQICLFFFLITHQVQSVVLMYSCEAVRQSVVELLHPERKSTLFPSSLGAHGPLAYPCWSADWFCLLLVLCKQHQPLRVNESSRPCPVQKTLFCGVNFLTDS